MRISDWSSDVGSSDLRTQKRRGAADFLCAQRASRGYRNRARPRLVRVVSRDAGMRIITDYQTVDTHAEPAPLGRECERQVHLTRLRRGRMRVAGQSQPDVARQIVDDRAGPAVQPAKKLLAAEDRKSTRLNS